MNFVHSHIVASEKPEDHDVVESIAELTFGPGRFTRTAFRLREGIPHVPELSFVIWLGGEIIASVRLTEIKVGKRNALLLGPLAVLPAFKNQGFGKELMETAVSASREGGHSAILLVGDFPYYGRFGFKPVPKDQITMPGPVDPARLLICPLQEESVDAFHGTAQPLVQ